jgi:hypothetical protein
MPFLFDLDTANGVLRCRVEGRLTDGLLKDLYMRAADYVAKKPPRAGIMDFSGVTRLQVTTETIHLLAQAPPVLRDMNSPRFIIATAPKAFGMARMFELMGQHSRPNLHVVRSLEAACAILGVKELHFEPVQDKARSAGHSAGGSS